MLRSPADERGSRERAAVATGAVLAIVLVVGVLVVLLRDAVVPPRFLADGQFIRQQALLPATPLLDRSYAAVVEVYRATGLAHQLLLAELLGFAAFAAVLLPAASGLRHRLTAPNIALVLASGVVGAVYLGWYSKDLFVLPIVALALVAARSRWLDAGLVVVMAAYGVGFRQYWLVVAAVYVAVRVCIALRRRASTVVAAGLAAALLLAVGVVVVLHQSPDYLRVAANSVRDVDDIGSAIRPLLPGSNPVLQVLELPLIAVTLLVPLPLAAGGGLYHLGLAAAILALWLLVGRATVVVFREPPAPWRQRWIALLVAFVAVQALFEPDYGSVLRHLTPLLPLAVALVLSVRGRGSFRGSVNAERQLVAR